MESRGKKGGKEPRRPRVGAGVKVRGLARGLLTSFPVKSV